MEPSGLAEKPGIAPERRRIATDQHQLIRSRGIDNGDPVSTEAGARRVRDHCAIALRGHPLLNTSFDDLDARPEIVGSIDDCSRVRFDGRSDTFRCGTPTEQADARVQIEDRPIALGETSTHRLHERFGTTVRGLEERLGGHPPVTTGNRCGVRSIARVARIDNNHIIGKFHFGGASGMASDRLHNRHAFARPGAEAKRDLVDACKAPDANQFFERRVQRLALIGGEAFIGTTAPVAGSAVDHRATSRHPLTSAGGIVRYGRRIDASEADQLVGHDLDLETPGIARSDMQPIASAALTRKRVITEQRRPRRARFKDLDQVGSGPPLLRFAQANPHRLVRDRAVHKHHSAISKPGNRFATRRHALGANLFDSTGRRSGHVLHTLRLDVSGR